jgi:hypothetical protein
MCVSPTLGTVRWAPTGDQIGSQTVTLQAVDPYGGVATQTWTINVTGQDRPPVITSLPITTAQRNVNYFYAIQAYDPDGDPLTYTLSGFPGSGTISSGGLFTGSPFTLGISTITVAVSDGKGGTATQVYNLNVSIPAINYAPVITSTPGLTAVLGNAYSYTLTASDRDADTLTYSLVSTAPPGLTWNGTTHVLSGTATTAGAYLVQLQVVDAGGLKTTQYYTLNVRSNSAPTITSTWPTSGTVGLPYRYDVKATDADGDPLTYALSGTVPTGMTIDAVTGRIAWTPTATGTFSGIVVTVSDPYGGQATQTMSVTVSADTTAPTVELQLSPNPLALGKQETFIVFGSDNVAVTSLTVTVNGTNLPIDAHGQAFYTPTSSGNYTIVATAKDAAGNTATSTQTLNVTNPTGTPPTITLTAPIPDPVTHLDPNITAPTAVTGTVSDDHIGISYTVTVIRSTAVPRSRSAAVRPPRPARSPFPT